MNSNIINSRKRTNQRDKPSDCKINFLYPIHVQAGDRVYFKIFLFSEYN